MKFYFILNILKRKSPKRRGLIYWAFYFLFSFSCIARINLAFLFSALSLFKDRTAQIAAGSQPIKVICNIKQITPVKIFPRIMKDRNGNKIAINIIWF